MHSPSKHHLGAVKRILHYVSGTSDYGIWYKKVDDMRLIGYCDSDWAGSLDDRKAPLGMFSLLGPVLTLGPPKSKVQLLYHHLKHSMHQLLLLHVRLFG